MADSDRWSSFIPGLVQAGIFDSEIHETAPPEPDREGTLVIPLDSSDDDDEELSFAIAMATGLTFTQARTGDRDTIDSALAVSRGVLARMPSSHRRRAEMMTYVAMCLNALYKHTNDSETSGEAIRLFEEAASLEPGQAWIMANLSTAWYTRFEESGDLQCYEKSLSILKDAMSFDPNLQGGYYGHLAMYLWLRVKSNRQMEDLDRAIDLLKDAQAMPYFNAEARRAQALTNLAQFLQYRFDISGNIADLEESIKLEEEAIPLHRNEDIKYSAMTNLAAALCVHFKRTNNVEDLKQAIKLHNRVYKHESPKSMHRPVSLCGHAETMYTYYSHSKQIEHLNMAIGLYMEAISLDQKSDIHLAHVVNNFAAALHAKYTESGEYHWYESAIVMLSLCAKQGSLSNQIDISQSWIYYARKHDHKSTLEAYQTALMQVQQFLLTSPTLELQHKILTERTTLGIDAVSYAMQKNAIKPAIELLEQSRALLWSQIQQFKIQPHISARMNPVLIEEYSEISRKLERVATSPSPWVASALQEDPFGIMLKEKKDLVQTLNSVVEKIRQTPGCQDFMKFPIFASLQPVAKEGSVIVVNCSAWHSDVIIILNDRDPISFPLSETFYEEMKAHSELLLQKRQYIHSKPKFYSSALQDVLADVWESLVGPVVEKLEELGIKKGSRVWWCPTSYVSNIPLHAAGPRPETRNKYFCDFFVSSYTPTLAALITARAAAQEKREQCASILAITQADGSLQSVLHELDALRSLPDIEVQPLAQEDATPHAAREKFSEHPWVHLACHGTLEPGKPLDAAFVLADGARLTLLDIVKARLPNAGLAFLSACHTAEQTAGSAPEEVLHLAAAMHFCGFRSVVGTMWQMHDGDGPDLAREFYTVLLAEDGVEDRLRRSAKALHAATKALRKKKVGIERWSNFVHIGV